MTKQKKDKLPAQDWLPFFEEAGIRVDELNECKSERSKAIKVGQFLSPKVGREVPIQVGGRTGKAILRVEQDRANMKLYYMEVTWVRPSPEDDTPKDKIPPKDTKQNTKKPSGQQGEPPPSGKKKPKRPAKTRSKKQGEGRSDAAPADGTVDEVRTSTRAKKTTGNDEDWS